MKSNKVKAKKLLISIGMFCAILVAMASISISVFALTEPSIGDSSGVTISFTYNDRYGNISSSDMQSLSGSNVLTFDANTENATGTLSFEGGTIAVESSSKSVKFNISNNTSSAMQAVLDVSGVTLSGSSLSGYFLTNATLTEGNSTYNVSVPARKTGTLTLFYTTASSGSISGNYVWTMSKQST